MRMFSGDDLRRFLQYRVEIPEIHSHLPGNRASLSELASAAVETLLRWNVVNAELFTALKRERPHRVAEIDAVARAFNSKDATSENSALLELPQAQYDGPSPQYRRKDAESASERLLALYEAVERGEAGKQHAREIADLHRSLRGEFAELQPGDLLVSGRYLLLAERARSSTPGIVWHAYDRRLAREVALRLFNSTVDDPNFRAHIHSQAHMMARLKHPNIAEVLDPAVQEDPHYGYSTEFLRGGRLVDRIGVLRGAVHAVVTLTLKLAEALAYAHARGLVHGALELRCIDFANDGEPRLRDFGLSGVQSEVRLSRGALPFFAPEILVGGAPSPAADQYALARIAVTCLSGTESPLTSEQPLLTLGLPTAMLDVFSRALHGDPEQRFPRMEVFHTALASSRKSGAAPEPSPRQPTLHRSTGPAGNPFSAGNALDGKQVPGREEDIDRVLGLVDDHGSALLLGPRRSGKTSLLRHLERMLSVDHAVRSISLEPAPSDTPDALAMALAPELRGVDAPARAFTDGLRQEQRWPVLLIDELGYLRNANLAAMPSVFAWLRSISQGLASIVYAGSRSDWNQVMAVAMQQPGSSFGNDMVVHELGPLSREAALAFLSGTAPPDVSIPPDPVGAWILECCGTWPFYLQVMGHSIVDAARRRGDRRALKNRDALVELYEVRLLRERSHVFEGRWNELDVHVRSLILREREGLPEFSGLSQADKKLLRDAGMYNALNGGWLLERDQPFADWIRRKYDELKEP